MRYIIFVLLALVFFSCSEEPETSVTKEHIAQLNETPADAEAKKLELKNNFKHLLQHFLMDSINGRSVLFHRRWIDSMDVFQLEFTVAVDLDDAYPVVVYCLNSESNYSLSSLNALMDDNRMMTMEWRGSFGRENWTAFHGIETTQMVEAIATSKANKITVYALQSGVDDDLRSWDELDQADREAVKDCIELVHTLRSAKDYGVDLLHE